MKALNREIEKLTKRQAILSEQIRESLQALARKASEQVDAMGEDMIPCLTWIQAEMNELQSMMARKEEIARADMMLRQIKDVEEMG